MALEQGKIGYWQLVLLMIGYIIGPSILLVPAVNAGHDAWIAIALSIGEGILLFLTGMMLCARFPGKTLVQINETVYGPYCGKLISIVYLWFLFHVGTLILTTFKYFFLITTLPQTPSVVITVIMTLVCAYAVKNGVEVIGRCGQILVTTSFVAFVISTLLLYKSFEPGNLAPVFEVPLERLVTEVHGSATFLYGDTIAFMMIIPYLKNINGRRIIKAVATAFITGGLFVTFVAIRNIGTLGPMNAINFYPTFQADRLINVGNLLTRLEIFTVTGFLTLAFINLSLLLYGTVLGGAQLLGLSIYRPLILPVGIIMALVALLNFKDINGSMWFAGQIYPIYAIPFQVGIPLATLIVAVIRGLPGIKNQ